MSEISVSWTPVAPSRRREILLLAALAVSGGVFTATLVAWATRSDPTAAIAGGLVALVVGGARREVAGVATWWRIGGDGSLFVRVGGHPQVRADAAFASRGLIVLRHGGRTTAIWRDAAPAPAFRRLSAAVRWPSAHAQVGPIDARPDATGRT